MKKPKRITPEQYVVLAKLSMPVTCVPRYSSKFHHKDETLVMYLLDEGVQIGNRNNCEVRAKCDYLFYTLVEEDRSET